LPSFQPVTFGADYLRPPTAHSDDSRLSHYSHRLGRFVRARAGDANQPFELSTLVVVFVVAAASFVVVAIVVVVGLRRIHLAF
jgi:hypothetical protein